MASGSTYATFCSTFRSRSSEGLRGAETAPIHRLWMAQTPPAVIAGLVPEFSRDEQMAGRLLLALLDQASQLRRSRPTSRDKRTRRYVRMRAGLRRVAICTCANVCGACRLDCTKNSAECLRSPTPSVRCFSLLCAEPLSIHIVNIYDHRDNTFVRCVRHH